MAAHAIELLQNDKVHCQFSAEAKEQAGQKFDYRLIVPQYEQLYERALNS